MATERIQLLPNAMSHSPAVRLSLPVARLWLSGLKATTVTPTMRLDAAPAKPPLASLLWMIVLPCWSMPGCLCGNRDAGIVPTENKRLTAGGSIPESGRAISADGC